MIINCYNFSNAHKKICEKSKAKFKGRHDEFLVEDIENGYDLSYDWVG